MMGKMKEKGKGKGGTRGKKDKKSGNFLATFWMGMGREEGRGKRREGKE